MSALLGGGGSGSGSGRTIVTVATDYYVNATTGSDTTGTGAIGNPWRTIQHAANYVMYSITGEGVQIRIVVQAGTYTEQVFLGPHQVFDPGETGFATVILQIGDKASPSAITIAPPGGSITWGILNVHNFAGWDIRGGFTLTVGTSGVTSAFSALTGLFSLSVAAVIITDAIGILFDAEMGGNVIVAVNQGGGIGVTIECQSTVGTIALADEKSTVEFYAGLTFTFDVDPGFNGTFGGAWVANFGGGSQIVSRATYSGSSAASPSASVITDGNTLDDLNQLMPATLVTLGNGSRYNDIFNHIAGTRGAASVATVDGGHWALQGVVDTNEWCLTGIVYGTSGIATNGPAIAFAKTRGASPTTQTAVQSGDELAAFYAYGSDGSAFKNPALFRAIVEGSVSANNIPTGWGFITGHSLASQAEALHLTNDQVACIGINQDTGFSRTAAGSLALGNGTAGDNSGRIDAIGMLRTPSAVPPTTTDLPNDGDWAAFFDGTGMRFWVNRSGSIFTDDITIGYTVVDGNFSNGLLYVDGASHLVQDPNNALAYDSGATKLLLQTPTLYCIPVLIANLPSAPNDGQIANVSDGDPALAWGATVVNSGAGATSYGVRYNAAAGVWRVFAM